jgi:hypothetical protein
MAMMPVMAGLTKRRTTKASAGSAAVFGLQGSQAGRFKFQVPNFKSVQGTQNLGKERQIFGPAVGRVEKGIGQKTINLRAADGGVCVGVHRHSYQFVSEQ